MFWQLLVLSLPTENATARMRAWRALKASGAIGELEIIVVTALTEHTIAERGGLPAGVTVLYKPLHFAELRKRLDPLVAQWQQAAAG